jgi:hypothetical protein
VRGLDDHSKAGIDAEGMYICTYAHMYLPSFSVAEPGTQSALFTAHNYQSLFVSWELSTLPFSRLSIVFRI